MAPQDDPAFQQAMDKLLLQVDTDNVLAVHRAFQEHADELRLCLRQGELATEVGLCGQDPVSHDAKVAFSRKIGQLLDVHWKHWQELDAVAGRLREVARSYGHTEDAISASLAPK